jgi:5-methylcytosine-specific restriction endonuclease McrA
MIQTLSYIWRNPELVTRNPSEVTNNVRRAYKTVKSMNEFRRIHKEQGTYFCRFSGKTKNLHVHHIIPVSVRPDLADDHSNMILLSQKFHLYVAHGGNWKKFVRNVNRVCAVRDLVETQAHENS